MRGAEDAEEREEASWNPGPVSALASPDAREGEGASVAPAQRRGGGARAALQLRRGEGLRLHGGSGRERELGFWEWAGGALGELGVVAGA